MGGDYYHDKADQADQIHVIEEFRGLNQKRMREAEKQDGGCDAVKKPKRDENGCDAHHPKLYDHSFARPGANPTEAVVGEMEMWRDEQQPHPTVAKIIENVPEH